MKFEFKAFFIFLVSSTFLSSCSSSGRLIGPSGVFDKDSHPVPVNYSQIVLFREANNSTSKDSVLVKSDSRVLGGLKEEDYLASKVCPGDHTLHFETIGNQPNVQDVQVVAPKGATAYVGVTVAAGGIINVNQFTEESALELLHDNTYQSFLVNRILDECNPTSPPVKLKNIELSADALFAFDGSSLTDLIAKNKLNQLLEEINTPDLNVTNIVVVGHTDRLGSKKYNQNLSEERAKTVANYLIANGVEGDIRAIGFGSAQPVTTQCSAQLTRSQLIECLQPDRRVTVELWGNFKVIDKDNSQK
jgi:outer membrane protein OmpA-like peptidoglycan-associated protein